MCAACIDVQKLLFTINDSHVKFTSLHAAEIEILMQIYLKQLEQFRMGKKCAQTMLLIVITPANLNAEWHGYKPNNLVSVIYHKT